MDEAPTWLWATIALTLGAFGAAVVWAPTASATPTRGLAWLLFLGSAAHVAATGWLFTSGAVRAHAGRHRARYCWAPLGLVCAGAMTAALMTPAALSVLLLGYFGWQLFHFQKQNLGLVALAAVSHGLAPLRRGERRTLVGSGAAGIAGLLARPEVLQIGIHYDAVAAYEVAAVGLAGSVAAGVVCLWRRPAEDRAAGFCTLYLIALLFPLPLFVFASPYAAVGGMTIAHGFQYLLLLGLVATGNRRGRRRTVELTVLANIALVGGALLAGASHLHGAAPLGRLWFGVYLGVVMAHFVIDAAFWRLRDPFVRQYLARALPFLAPPDLGAAILPVADRSLPDIS